MSTHSSLSTQSKSASNASGDTIAARLTGPGRSAIAVIGVRGDQIDVILRDCFATANSRAIAAGQVRFGQWKSGESIVVTPIDGNQVELHCHGGVAAIDRILQDLEAVGVKIVSEAEFAERHQPRLVVEAQLALSQCLTAKTAAVALDQVRGAMLDWAKTQAEHLEIAPQDYASVKSRAESVLQWAKWGLRLGQPFRVVIVGPPNVGKSTLINRIVGYDRSITTSTAGTTRDVLRASTVIDGLPVEISDTAGIRETSNAIESEGIARAKLMIGQADLILRVSDPDTDFVPRQWEARTMDVLNKADLISEDMLIQTADLELLRVSAKLDPNVDSLLAVISTVLCEKLPESGQPVPLNARQHEALQRIRDAENASQAKAAIKSLIA